ncbi:MAG: hypothetical protein ABIK15_13065 [Pseudomonadota bacterium]
MMKFTIYAYLSKHPIQMKLMKYWVRLGLPVPSFLKRQVANEIHVEMIARLMDIVLKENTLTLERALQVHFDLGKEMAPQVKELLSINPNNAKSLSRIIDFLHDLLFITGKEIVEISPDKTTSHWHKCPLADQLSHTKGGAYYCHLFQEMYKGVLLGINPNARTNDLKMTKSQGFDCCELQTWIE